MILVTGSTGNIGSPLIRMLVEAKAPVRALVRDPGKESKAVEWMRANGVEVAAGDLAEPTSLSAALADVETAFLLTPVSRDQVAWKANFIRAAQGAKVRRIVNLSVAGASPGSPIILGRWHFQSEQELEESGLGVTNLRPYDLARYNTRLFLTTAETQSAFYSTVGEGRVAMVDEEDVAAVAAKALLDAAHSGKTYTLTGPEALSYSEFARAISEQTGKPVRYVNVTEPEAKQAMLAAGIPEWIADFIIDLRRIESQNGASVVTTDVQQVTGRPATPYETSLRAALNDG